MFSRYIHAEIISDGFRDKIFDAEILAALGRALSDKDSDIRRNAVNFFTSTITQGAPRCFQWDIHSEIAAEGFRDQIFDAEIPVALGRALGHTYFHLRSSAFNFFTAAIAQGAPRYFMGYSY